MVKLGTRKKKPKWMQERIKSVLTHGWFITQVISQPVTLGGRKQSWSKGFPAKLAESQVSAREVLEMDGGDS